MALTPDESIAFEGDLALPPPYSRPVMDQDEFDKKYGYRRPNHDHGKTVRHLKKFTKRYWKPFTSPQLFLKTVISFMPILTWFPAYDWKANFIGDFLGGITLSVINIPQGIAYAVLCKVHPVVGLYTSLFPPFFYMFFGTSMHSSIGSFAVISLMSGKSVTRICGIKPLEVNGTAIEEFDSCALQVVSTLAFCVGLVHIIMAVLRLEVIVTYFSDQLISGFTTGASCHVFVTQISPLLGITAHPEPFEGFGRMFRRWYVIITNIHQFNWMTALVGGATIVILVATKDYLGPYLKKKFKLPIPIPFELMIVILSTAISAIFKLHERFGVKTTGYIPTGFPLPQLPNVGVLPDVFVDALSIAFVVIAIHISLSKMVAKKLNYKVDAGQELYAFGLCSSLSAFFPIYPVSNGFGRTMVSVEAGTKTQLSAIANSLVLVAAIAYFGKYLETLPMCVLAGTIIVALKNIVRKFSELRILWPLSRTDFSIWIVSFVVTAGWDVVPGLVISIAFSLMTTVFRTQYPRWNYLASPANTDDYLETERYLELTETKGICIFRFDAPLLFTNIERFKSTIHKAFDKWQCKSSPFSSIVFPEELNITEKQAIYVTNYVSISSNKNKIAPSAPVAGLLFKHFIIDCSGFTSVDYMGINALKEIFSEMRTKQVLIYFAGLKSPVKDLFEASGFHQYVPKCDFYPTIRDAILTAQKRRNASTLHLADEVRISYEALDDAITHQTTVN